MHLILLSIEGVSILKTFHCLVLICEPTIESLLCFEGIILFNTNNVLRRKGMFLIHLFVVSASSDTGEELVGLLGQLRVMFRLTEKPPLHTLISGRMFSDIALKFFELSLLRGIIPF